MAFPKLLFRTMDHNILQIHFPNLLKNGDSHIRRVALTTLRTMERQSEHAVKTAQILMTKWEDPYLALLWIYSSRIADGQKTRLDASVATGKTVPKLPDAKQLRKTELAYKRQQALDYNKHHRTSVLPDIYPGDNLDTRRKLSRNSC